MAHIEAYVLLVMAATTLSLMAAHVGALLSGGEEGL